MVFFTDFNLDLDCAIGITNLLSNITTKDHSHKGGWAKLLRCQLINEGYKDVTILDKSHKLSDFGCIVFDLGAEFSGGLNMFGGLDTKVHNRLLELINFKGGTGKVMFSWQHELPNILALDKRRSNESTCQEFKESYEGFIPDLQAHLNNVVKFDHVAKKDKLLIGDSHTPSVWDPSFMIDRGDGRTLYGMLGNNTLCKAINDFNNKGITLNEIQVYAGNIDVRHHLLRQTNPWSEAQRLAEELVYVARDLITKVSLTSLLPIENESRKLPKTGYFKGTPFKGSWRERSAAVEIFNNILINATDQGINVYNHPKSFYNELGELKFDVMERPKSVHLSPKYYKWNLDENKLRN